MKIFSWDSILSLVSSGQEIPADICSRLMNELIQGKVPEQVRDFFIQLHQRGEKPGEILAFIKALRKAAKAPFGPFPDLLIDTCGTGGDGSHTLNLSTGAAFILSAAGIPVAKHGNRSVTSKCGSADVLEALGIPIHIKASRVSDCLQECGFCFLFAPDYHSGMKHVANLRKSIPHRTVFNLLGPLLNPMPLSHQIIGVFDPSKMKIMIAVCKSLGLQGACAVHTLSPDGTRPGCDELTRTGPQKILGFQNGSEPFQYNWSEDIFGGKKIKLSALRGGNAEENASWLEEILSGKRQDDAYEILCLNAGVGIWISGKSEGVKEGIQMAKELIQSGKTKEILKKCRASTKFL